MLIPGIHTAMVLAIDTDMGEERRGKPNQQPQPTLRPMLSLGTLPMDMGVDIMERSNLCTMSRSSFDNSPVTIAHFNTYLFL